MIGKNLTPCKTNLLNVKTNKNIIIVSNKLFKVKYANDFNRGTVKKKKPKSDKIDSNYFMVATPVHGLAEEYVVPERGILYPCLKSQ
jgi:hypothetical protein